MKRRDLISSMAWAGIAPLAWGQASDAPVPRKATLARSPQAAALPQKLVFGLITPRNPEQTLKNWNPFLDRMAASAGVQIERRTYTLAGDLVKDFVEGRLDLAWLGNAPALDIVEAGKGSVFATMVVQGKSAYRSLLIVHRDSAVRTLDDVHRQASQLAFGDGDPKSASGHIVPMYFAFVKRGINEPEKLFRQVRRASHESNLLATARREVDVATNNTSELDNFRTARPDQADLIRVVWESPDIPESPMVWRDSLLPALRNRIAAFTEGFGTRDDEEKGVLWNINKLTAFRKSSNRQLVTIADVEMFNARQSIMNNPGLSAQERLVQVDEVTRRGSRLELMLKRSS